MSPSSASNTAPELRGVDPAVSPGVCELSAALASGRITSLQTTQAHLARVARDDVRINAFITIDADSALAAANASDVRRARGQPLSALDGVPIALKDNIDLAGLPTTNGIAHFRAHRAAADAFVTARLRAAGAVILGKLNMHEAALGATNDNLSYGRCHNPLRLGFTPGGSSGGSAAAVAAGFVAGALGSDTLGSVRIPAAYCGIAGFKPTFGTISTRGVTPLAWTLDTIGVLAPTIADCALLAGICKGFDRDWPYARRGPWQIEVKRFPDPLRLEGLRVGRPTNLDSSEIEVAVLAAYELALERLARQGAAIVPVALTDYDPTRVRREALLVVEIEGAATFGDAIDADPDGFSAELRAMLAFGAKQTAVRAARAYRRLAEVRSIGRRVFASVDVLALPTAPQVAFAHDTPVPANQADLTSFASILGVPAGCVPFGVGRDGMPCSIQVLARAFDDDLTLDVLSAIELLA